MTAEKPTEDAGNPERSYDQGFAWEGGELAELAPVIEAAFDYRGNISVEVENGERVLGYLYNREAEAAPAFIDIFPVEGGQRRVLYSDIRRIEFTGRDTAAGKSWETWLEKYNAKKAAEARGEKVGSIDLFPEELD